jgi:hypothetical protein
LLEEVDMDIDDQRIAHPLDPDSGPPVVQPRQSDFTQELHGRDDQEMSEPETAGRRATRFVAGDQRMAG